MTENKLKCRLCEVDIDLGGFNIMMGEPVCDHCFDTKETERCMNNSVFFLDDVGAAE